MLLVSLLIAITLGWLGVRAVIQVNVLRPRWAAWLLEVSLGIGLGAGLTSVLLFLLLLVGATSRGPVIALEIALLVAGAVFVFARARRAGPAEKVPDEPGQPFAWNWALAIALSAGFLLVIAVFFNSARANPFGDWDAWSLWNLHAKFLMAPGDLWRNVYSPLQSHTHPDYPLLLPGFVARTWKYLGAGTPTSAPIAAAFLFEAASIGLVISAIAIARSVSAGLLAGLVLLVSAAFLAQGSSQYADMPLSLFMLATLALLLMETKPGVNRRSFLILAGCFGGLGAWTKNEGLMFLGIVVMALFLVEARAAGWKRAFERLQFFALGALPMLAVSLYFKVALAPKVDIYTAQSFSQALGKLGDPGRYAQIAKTFLSEGLHFGNGLTHPVVLLAILAAGLRFGVAREQRRWIVVAGLTLLLMLAVYFGAYLITTADLEWQLSTSAGRLLAQVWPSTLLLVFVILRRPEDTAAVQGEQSQRSSRKKPKKEKARRK
jgi:hypothetical protein